MEELNLTDVYGELHPKSKSFTYISKLLNLKSRIDYFLIPRSLFCDVRQAEIRISTAPDHNAIFYKVSTLKVSSIGVQVYGNLTTHCWKTITIKN